MYKVTLKARLWKDKTVMTLIAYVINSRIAGKERLRYSDLRVLLDFSLTVKAATFIFIYGRGSTISSAMEGKSGFIHNLVKS